MKIKERFKTIIHSIKNAVERFPVTIIVVFLYMLFLAIIFDTDFISDEILEYVSSFVVYFSAGAFLTESVFKGKDKKSILYYIMFAVISIALVIIQSIDWGSEFFDNNWWKFIFSYITTLLILGVYFLTKKADKNFTEYILKVAINFIKTNIVYGILAIGIAIISSIFIYLILDGEGYSLIARLEILLIGVYYFPKIMYSFVDIENEVNNFFKGLIKYVLNALVITSFVIIYMYIIKILILRDMPKNQIFRILSALFIVGMPIWNSVSYFKDESFWYKISLKLPLAYIPFIFLQIYTIGVRILANGLTPARYMCIALIVFEIIYILIYIFKKQKLEILLLVLNGMILISVLLPGINMYKLSDLSQAKILQRYKEKINLSEEEMEKIYGAYQYLKYSDDGETYIKDILDENDIKEIKEFGNSNDYNDSKVEYITYHSSIQEMDIKGYSKLNFVNAYDYNVNKSVEACFKDFRLENLQTDYFITLDLQEEVNEYIQNYDEEDFHEYFESNNEIKFSDKKLIIEEFRLRYNTNTKKIEYYSINGYVLEK